MKVYHWLLIILAAAVLFLSIRIAFNHSEGCDTAKPTTATSENIAENAALECIMTRTSIRAYSGREVSDSTVNLLLRAGMAAPTAMNKQPWHFTVITDKELRKKIAEEFKGARYLKDAPLAIVVSGNLAKAIEGEGEEYWVQDCSAASENILLAAHASGLGAVWCGIYPIAERVRDIKKLLGMPDNLIPLNIIVIGYPQGESSPKDKWNPDNVTYSSR